MALYSNSTHLSLVSSPVLGKRRELSILGGNMRAMGAVETRALVIGPLLLLLPAWELELTLGGWLSIV